MPAPHRFAPPKPFGGKTSHTWALMHGTSVTADQCTLLEGFVRPADWTFNPDLKHSQLPTFGAYALGQEVARSETQIPLWIGWTELRRRGRVSFQYYPILIGALYEGKEAHLS